MILCLSFDADLHRGILDRSLATAGGVRLESVLLSCGDPRLPSGRQRTPSEQAIDEIDRLAPSIAVVTAGHADVDELQIAYRVETGGSSCLPDVLYDHRGAACCVTDRDTAFTPTGFLPTYREPTVAAIGRAVLGTLRQHCVIVALCPPHNSARKDEAIDALLTAALAAFRIATATAKRACVPNREELEAWTAEAARVLRLTVSQLASLKTAAHAVCVRGGSLPELPTLPVRIKREGKVALARLEGILDGASRPSV